MELILSILAAVVAVGASPVPQGITAAIAPAGTAPAGCMDSYTSSFGIAVMKPGVAGSAVATQSADGQPGAASQISDGQPQAGVTQISDGQIQAGTMTMMAVSQIHDGQIQAPTCVATQIGDGQPQVGCMAVSQIADGQPQVPTAATVAAVTQISDAQPQAPTATAQAVSQISDAQPQVPTATAVSQISDAQPQAPTAAAVSQISDAQPQATEAASMSSGMAACQSSDTLVMTLNDGVLKDNKGRTGYIAANYQFQFDDPPQAGAIYTSGFSLCSNGTLALGGSTTFYQCRSGSFYNLYNENWAPQCEPANINALELVSC